MIAIHKAEKQRQATQKIIFEKNIKSLMRFLARKAAKSAPGGQMFRVIPSKGLPFNEWGYSQQELEQHLHADKWFMEEARSFKLVALQ